MRISSLAALAALCVLFALSLHAGPARAGLQEGIEAYAAGERLQALREWEAGAAEGDATAAYLAAKMHEGGSGTARVPRKAFAYMKMAAEGGHVQAQVELADMYRRGVPEADVPRDPAAALSWYEKAALMQHAEAQTRIGEMYDAGEGVPRNRFEAVRWYKLAAKKYYAPALIRLSHVYWNGDPLPQDKPLAYSYLLLAREAATDETRPGIEALLNERAAQMSAAQIDAGARLAEAFRREHPRR